MEEKPKLKLKKREESQPEMFPDVLEGAVYTEEELR